MPNSRVLPDLTGQLLLNSWRVGSLLGKGGCGAVYQALELEGGSEVAVKVVLRSDLERCHQLTQEFMRRQGIFHPNLLRVDALHQDGPLAFLVMERIRGASLQATLAAESPWRQACIELPTQTTRDHSTAPAVESPTARALPPWAARNTRSLQPYLQRLTYFLLQLQEGLEHLHHAGLLHGDLKPGNIMVDQQDRLVLLDFGLTRSFRESAIAPWAGAAGTLPYMAPEQLEEGSLTPLTDWYAVGVLLYELLTATFPFAGGRWEQLQNKRVVRPLPPSYWLPELPPVWDQLCLTLLEPDPARRADGPRQADGLRTTSLAPSAEGTGRAPAGARDPQSGLRRWPSPRSTPAFAWGSWARACQQCAPRRTPIL